MQKYKTSHQTHPTTCHKNGKMTNSDESRYLSSSAFQEIISKLNIFARRCVLKHEGMTNHKQTNYLIVLVQFGNMYHNLRSRMNFAMASITI